MKQFFKFMFASMLGTLVTIFISIIIFFVMIGAIISSAASSGKEKIVEIDDNALLHVKLDYPIVDRASNNPFENFNFETFEAKEALSLSSILKNIKKAKDDEKIKGIYLDLSLINGGMASVEEIRNALVDFKKSGKFIVSYSETYTQKTYYLASVADEVYLNPAGIMELRGLASQLMFFKGALEKLDIEAQIIRHGKFKSAVEPFMLDKMSDSNREQTKKILNSIWGSVLTDIAESRELTIKTINNLADSVSVRDAEDAVKYGFIDKLTYKDQVFEELRAKLGTDKDDEINYVALHKYKNSKPIDKIKDELKNKEKIAIVYASGSIVSGKSSKEEMGSETISKAIREARLDEDVKAIVLRVNSPGGSALASDVMWREVVLAKKVKPVIVSMGDVAASGGYYISCAADKIVASEQTITGSIGVFGMIPNAQGFFNNQLGITFDTVKTNIHSDMMTIFRPLTAEEKAIIQQGVEDVYDDFITKVAEGRGISKNQVDSIGQGRVWTGKDAKEIGLVDELGGLDKAIEIAADHAKLENYKLVAYPKRKDPFEEFAISIAGDVETAIMKKTLGHSYKYYKQLETVKNQRGIMAKMPYEIDVY